MQKYCIALVIITTNMYSIMYSVDRACDVCSFGKHIPSAITVTIPKNSSIYAIARILESHRVISNRWLFLIIAYFSGDSSTSKAGQYRFVPGTNYRDLLCALRKGLVVIHKITIPEGVTVSHVVNIVNANPCLRGTITNVPEEGYILPGTYYFNKGDIRQNIMNRVKNGMQKLLQQCPSKFLNSAELLNLASIVEKETKLPREKGAVASVFLARLQKNMRLQSCPTVIYALSGCNKWDRPRPLTYEDLKCPSPYNTYLHEGLPPTAICCPGRDTVAAVAVAKPGAYLYFVADNSGGHTFSCTYEEHLKNAQKAKEARGARGARGARP